jgi:hypothetical protein
MRRRLIVFFSVVQLVGLACAWLQHPPSAVSSFLWGAGFLMLFPGDLLSAWMVQKLFWHSRLSLASMSAISAVFLVVINAIIWLTIAKVLQVIHARLSTRSGVPAPRPTRS